MAIDLCSENSCMSPRLSFSHDLSLSDILPIEHRPVRSNSAGPHSSFDFDFVPIDQEPLSADEIFSDGKLLPTEIKKKPAASSSLAQKGHSRADQSGKQSRFLGQSSEAEEKPSLGSGSGSGSRSFWRFKRSTSLNCGSGHGRSLGLCPLPLLSRSNSTGSSPNVKSSTFSKENSDNSHPNSKKQSPKNTTNMSSPLKPSQAASSSFNGGYQKPPLRKGSGINVSPVLNVPPGNLFGLNSVFFSGKDKGKRKWSEGWLSCLFFLFRFHLGARYVKAVFDQINRFWFIISISLPRAACIARQLINYGAISKMPGLIVEESGWVLILLKTQSTVGMLSSIHLYLHSLVRGRLFGVSPFNLCGHCLHPLFYSKSFFFLIISYEFHLFMI